MAAHLWQTLTGLVSWKLPSEAHIAICNMFNIETEIKTIEDGQKDVLLRRTNIKKKYFGNYFLHCRINTQGELTGVIILHCTKKENLSAN